jgi:hypothetical protein
MIRERRAAKEKAQGPSKPQEPTPIIFPDMLWVWSAFCYLSDRRGVGSSGPVSITVEAMSHFATMTNRLERVYVDQLMHFVPILDREYMRDFYDKQAKEMEKARRKSEGPKGKRGLNRR